MNKTRVKEAAMSTNDQVASVLPLAERRERCLSLMRAQLLQSANKITELFLEMGSWPEPPAKLDINTARWLEAEAAIDKAAQAGQMRETLLLCDDYRERVQKYCDHKRATKAKGAANVA